MNLDRTRATLRARLHAIDVERTRLIQEDAYLVTERQRVLDSLADLDEMDLPSPPEPPAPEPAEPPTPDPELEPEPEPLPPSTDGHPLGYLQGMTYSGLQGMYRESLNMGTTYAQDSTHYALSMTSGGIKEDAEYHSARHGAVGSNMELRGLSLHTMGGDGIKWLSGELDVDGCYVTKLGMQAAAHADGIQDQNGYGTEGTVSDSFFDMENEVGDGSKPNACILLQARKQGGGHLGLYRTIFYGGNYTIVSSKKNTDNQAAMISMSQCAFIVDDRNPRYGLMKLEGAFQGFQNRIYHRGTDDVLRLVWQGDDPRDWDGSFDPIGGPDLPALAPIEPTDPEPPFESPTPDPLPPVPTPSPEPPTEPAPPISDLFEWCEDWQRFMPKGLDVPPVPMPPFATALPMNMEGRPTSYDWWVSDGGARCPRTGDTIKASECDGNLVAEAIRREYDRRAVSSGEPVVIAIYDNGGTCRLAHSSSAHGHGNSETVAIKGFDGGYRDLDVVLVGKSDQARVELSWADGHGFGQVDTLSVYDLGLVGSKWGAFCVKANNGCGDIRLQGHWYLPHPELKAGAFYKSVLHIDDYRSLVILEQKWAGLYVSEHSVAYLKRCTGKGPHSHTWVGRCDLYGGGRTGFQRRPGIIDYPEGDSAPMGDVIAWDNFSYGAGWANPIHDGGGQITVWTAPDSRVFVFDNDIRDARYTCLAINGQGEYEGKDLNWYGEDGYPIMEAHVWGNNFSNPRSEREGVVFSSIARLFLYGPMGAAPMNAQQSQYVLDHRWAMVAGGKMRNGQVRITPEAEAALDLRTYRSETDRMSPLREEEIAPMRG